MTTINARLLAFVLNAEQKPQRMVMYDVSNVCSSIESGITNEIPDCERNDYLTQSVFMTTIYINGERRIIFVSVAAPRNL